MGCAHLPRLLFHHARGAWPNAPAMREKRSRYLADLDPGGCQRRVARSWLRPGLAGLHKRGDNLAIIGDNRPPSTDDDRRPVSGWRAGAAVPGCGGRRNAVRAAGCRHPLRVVEDQEQVDKMLEGAGSVPTLEHRYDDPRGMRHYTQPFCTAFTN